MTPTAIEVSVELPTSRMTAEYPTTIQTVPKKHCTTAAVFNSRNETEIGSILRELSHNIQDHITAFNSPMRLARGSPEETVGFPASDTMLANEP